MEEKMLKRKLLFFAVPLLLVSVLFVTNKAKAITGAGTKEDPYKVYTAEDLGNVNLDARGYYLQMNDIDLENKDFPEICNSNDLEEAFYGTYDGNNYKIKNLKIIRSTEENSNRYDGLFATIKGATLKNIHIVNAVVEGYDGGGTSGSSTHNYSGGLVGRAHYYSDITNCSITGNGYIHGNSAGGLIGITAGPMNISNCSSNITVTGRERIGGLVGTLGNQESNVKRCYAICDVKPRSISNQSLSKCMAGGISGRSSGISIYSECYSTGSIVGVESAGGISPTGADKLKAENCFSLAYIEAESVGGLFRNPVNMTHSYFAGTLNGTARYGLCEYSTLTSINQISSYFDGEKNNVDDKRYSKLTSGMLQQSGFVNWNFKTIWAIDENISYPYLRNLPIPDEVNIRLPEDSSPQSISLTPKSKNIDIHEVLTLQYQISPQYAADEAVTFSSDNPSAVIVNEKGQVVALSEGTATITAKTSNNKAAHCVITVGSGGGTQSTTPPQSTSIPVEGIQITPSMSVINLLSEPFLEIGYTITPSNAENQKIKWISSNPEIAEIYEENGKVYVVGNGINGYVTVIAMTESNHKMAFCNILCCGEAENWAFRTNVTATASSYFGDNQSNPSDEYSPKKAHDALNSTYWKMSDNNPGEMFLALNFDNKRFINYIKISESGNNIKDYTLQYMNENGYWMPIGRGGGIGNDYSIKFPTVYTSKIRLLIHSRVSNSLDRLPAINDFGIYYMS